MLTATRVVTKAIKRAPVVRGSISKEGCSSTKVSKVVMGEQVSKNVLKIKYEKVRKYTTEAGPSKTWMAQREKEGAAPEQPEEITFTNVNHIAPEMAALYRYLPKQVPVQELSVIEARVREEKALGNVPALTDSLWVMLANLKLGKMDRALVAWNRLVKTSTPDVLYWNLIMVFCSQKKDYASLIEIYEHFKYAVIKRKLEGPSAITHNILLKSFSARGDVARVMEIYDDIFGNGRIPEIYHLRSILKAAALAGEPKMFHRFFTRLTYKGITIKPAELKNLIDIWGKKKVVPEYLKRQHVTTSDFAYAIDYALRVRNYRRAILLIQECRDSLNIQPDARMYETFLAACIRDGHLKEQARSLKRRFHKYPKAIEVREEHFEFNDFVKALQASIGEASLANLPPVDLGERISFVRTSRKDSSNLYGANPRVRYESGWDIDEFEWVPEYTERKKNFALAQEQSAKAAELAKLMKNAKTQAQSL